MMRSIACFGVLLAAMPASAQGVFNMGSLTGTLSQDGVTQTERSRSARGARGGGPTRARTAAQNCALRPQFKARFGANHPDSKRFDAMCRALGY